MNNDAVTDKVSNRSQTPCSAVRVRFMASDRTKTVRYCGCMPRKYRTVYTCPGKNPVYSDFTTSAGSSRMMRAICDMTTTVTSASIKMNTPTPCIHPTDTFRL